MVGHFGVSKTEVNAAVAVTNTLEPFECITMDTICPLPSDDDGNCYVIALIDCFSQRCELLNPIQQLKHH